MKYDTSDVRIIRIRIAKIQMTRSCRHCRIRGKGQCEKSDESNTGNTVGLETICGRTDAVTCIVTGTVSDNTGVLRIIFGKMEDDLHKVGTDIGDLCEDTTCNPECACAERFTDGKTDETGACQYL